MFPKLIDRTQTSTTTRYIFVYDEVYFWIVKFIDCHYGYYAVRKSNFLEGNDDHSIRVSSTSSQMLAEYLFERIKL